MMGSAMTGIYFVAENLVLWARSETIGYAVNICHGMMEFWNVGILGLAELDLFLLGWHGSEYKIRPSSAFDSQYSIIPPFHYSIRSLR